jgi:hypothetical protein
MPIDVSCGACGRAIKAPDKLAGKKVKCPQCATVVAVPAGAPAASSHMTPPASPAASARASAKAHPRQKPLAQQPSRSPPTRQVFQAPPRPASQPEPPPLAGVGDLLHEELTLDQQRRIAESEAEYERQQQEAIRYAYEAPKRAAEVLRSRGIHGQYAGARRLDAGFAIGRGWDLYKRHFGMLLLVTVLGFVLNVALQGLVTGIGFGVGLGIGAAVNATMQDERMAAIVAVVILYVFQLLNVVPGSFVWAGQLRYMLRLAKDQPAELIDIFKGGHHVLALVSGMVTMMVIGLLPYLPGTLLYGTLFICKQIDFELPRAVVVGLSAVGGIAALVLWVITIRLLFKRSLFPFIAVDLKTSGGDAMELSSRLMSGSVGGVLLIYLTALALILLGVLTCGIGLIFTAPLAQIILTAAFVDMTGEAPRVPAA